MGASGAGTPTLLALAADPARPRRRADRPTEGTLTVLGGTPARARERLAHVAQDKPPHPQLTVAEAPAWGASRTRGAGSRPWPSGSSRRAARPRTPPCAPCPAAGAAGSRALAPGKRPELLPLDEPMADPDPLARHRPTGLRVADAAERGTTVAMSPHAVSEPEGCCDHLLPPGAGRARPAGPLETSRPPRTPSSPARRPPAPARTPSRGPARPAAGSPPSTAPVPARARPATAPAPPPAPRDALGVGGGLIALLPLAAAAWAGGAPLGREPENGTPRPAWTRSVTSARGRPPSRRCRPRRSSSARPS
ncbi:hypothetical protein GCM10020295_45270 [Streptomyces cinereospinus]